jgi:hypothetical protein
MRLVLGAALLGVLVVTAAPARSVTVSPCRSTRIAATFSVIPGSRGAGNVVYALRVQNTARAACFVSGLPALQLLGRSGRRLPTRVTAENRGALTAVRVVLQPGGWASASARFTPDVPGPGEGNRRQCEPTAVRVRVTVPPGGATTTARVMPATPVCVHGRMTMSALVAGRKPPHG